MGSDGLKPQCNREIYKLVIPNEYFNRLCITQRGRGLSGSSALSYGGAIQPEKRGIRAVAPCRNGERERGAPKGELAVCMQGLGGEGRCWLLQPEIWH